MGSAIRNEYEPDHISPPGETLLDTIEALGMAQTELAERTGRPTKTINEIIKGKAAITPETAIQLERVLGIAASFWNNRQRRYDEYQARREEQARLQARINWVKLFPVAHMTRVGWLEKTRDKIRMLQQLLNFFGVASPEVWTGYWDGMQVDYRKSDTFKSDPYALAAWLRKGELIANEILCGPYDPDRFRRTLRDVRALTTESPETFCPKLAELCSACGVAVAFVPELPKTASGATRWLSPKKALLQLSLRYRTDDHLWFTFFHEAGHILLHEKKVIFLETDRCGSQSEAAANDFAANTLIPRKAFEAFVAAGQFDEAGIRRFAREEGIAPGIVVGRLQHDGMLPYAHFNALKRRFTWAS